MTDRKTEKNSTLSLRDPIYKFIEVERDLCADLIDRDFFQRLRWVNQLPLEQLVYPSAVHSRFEHSLGTMFLAQYAAKALIKNENARLGKLLELDRLSADDFIRGAAIAGLLHDVGHAPFSHTFEDATKYEPLAVVYDHEKLGYSIAEKLIGGKKQNYYQVALRALNKDLKESKQSCAKQSRCASIIKKIIDGPIDVDKGDYLLRDSYHCGVEYGVYSWQRLWSNVALTRDLRICVNEKGAEEAWTLMLNRYKMHRTVYKHHVRMVTDAMLVKLIRHVFREKDGPNKIFPSIHDHSFTGAESEFFFKSWNDGSFLSTLSEYHKNRAERDLVDRFLQRSLYKRGFDSNSFSTFSLPEEWLEGERSTDVRRKIRAVLDKLEDNIEQNGIHALAIIEYPIQPPVFEKVQDLQGVVVAQANGEEIPLAEFLGFGIKLVDDTEEIPEEEGEEGSLPARIDFKSHFLKKQKSRLVIFTSSAAYSDNLEPEQIADFIKREWGGI